MIYFILGFLSGATIVGVVLTGYSIAKSFYEELLVKPE